MFNIEKLGVSSCGNSWPNEPSKKIGIS